jgi:NADPH2:quinone reductase
MKALLSTAPGGPETLAFSDLPSPAAAPGEVVISVKAVGVNFPDVLIIRYAMRPVFSPSQNGDDADKARNMGR